MFHSLECLSVCHFQAGSPSDALDSLRRWDSMPGEWGKLHPTVSTPHSAHTTLIALLLCIVSTWILPCLQCSLLLEGYWPFWSVTILSCSHLWAQHHVVYSAEHIKLGVFPFSWDLMFGFGRKWRETKSSNSLRTQDFKKKAWQCLGPSSCSQPSAQATHIYWHAPWCS